MPLRIGCVKYLNARPLIHGWPGPVAVSIIQPRFAGSWRAGELDVALVSSFEFLAQSGLLESSMTCRLPRTVRFTVFLSRIAGSIDGSAKKSRSIRLRKLPSTLLRCLLAESADYSPRSLPRRR